MFVFLFFVFVVLFWGKKKKKRKERSHLVDGFLVNFESCRFLLLVKTFFFFSRVFHLDKHIFLTLFFLFSTDAELYYFKSVWGWGATEDVARIKKGVEKIFQYDALTAGKWKLEVFLSVCFSFFVLWGGSSLFCGSKKLLFSFSFYSHSLTPSHSISLHSHHLFNSPTIPSNSCGLIRETFHLQLLLMQKLRRSVEVFF